jgi:hypothetical protein
MATKIYLQGNTTHIEKGTDVWTYPMANLSYSLTNSVLSIYCAGVFIMSDASNVIDDINDATLGSDAAVRAYLDQFIGASDISNVSNATVSSVTSVATTDTLLLAANEHRSKALIFNNSTATLYVKYGTGASAASFTKKVIGLSIDPLVIENYKGILHFFHSALNGTIEVTEIHV